MRRGKRRVYVEAAIEVPKENLTQHIRENMMAEIYKKTVQGRRVTNSEMAWFEKVTKPKEPEPAPVVRKVNSGPLEDRIASLERKALDTIEANLDSGKPWVAMQAAKTIAELGKKYRPNNEVIDVQLIEIGVIDGKVVRTPHVFTPKGEEEAK